MAMKSSPIISVCIPVFNGEKYILESINSVLDQKFTDYELVIVDNCSTDNTANIIKNINQDKIRYIKNKKNIGSINNFNKCIKEAKGDFFLLLPHDDLLLPDCLEKCLNKFENPNVGLVYSSIRAIDKNGNIIFNKVNHSENKLFTPEKALADIVVNFQPIQLAMVRTSILKTLNGFDLKFGLFCDVHRWSSSYESLPFSSHRIHDQQGQNAFFNSDLKTLSKHWGKKLDKSFFHENSYNGLFLRLIRFCFNEFATYGYDFKNLDTILLKLFIKLHLRNIIYSFFRFDFFIFFNEILLMKPLLKIYSCKKILFYYLYVVFKEIKIKISNKFF